MKLTLRLRGSVLFSALSGNWLLAANTVISADRSPTSAATTPQYAQRRFEPGFPLHLCHFSAFSRASRRHKMSIQRLQPNFPPDISADKMQIVQ
jgi:hypothetical protein